MEKSKGDYRKKVSIKNEKPAQIRRKRKDNKICQDNVNTELRQREKNLRSLQKMLIIKTRKPGKKSVELLNNKSTERELEDDKATTEKHYELLTLVFTAKHAGKTPKPRPFQSSRQVKAK